MGRKASFWTSRTFLTALALSAVGTVFLLSGHRAHLLGAIPYGRNAARLHPRTLEPAVRRWTKERR